MGIVNIPGDAGSLDHRSGTVKFADQIINIRNKGSRTSDRHQLLFGRRIIDAIYGGVFSITLNRAENKGNDIIGLLVLKSVDF